VILMGVAAPALSDADRGAICPKPPQSTLGSSAAAGAKRYRGHPGSVPRMLALGLWHRRYARIPTIWIAHPEGVSESVPGIGINPRSDWWPSALKWR